MQCRDNTGKVWAHWFLAKPKTIAAGGLRGTVSPLGGLEGCLGEGVGAKPSNNFCFI